MVGVAVIALFAASLFAYTRVRADGNVNNPANTVNGNQYPGWMNDMYNYMSQFVRPYGSGNGTYGPGYGPENGFTCPMFEWFGGVQNRATFQNGSNGSQRENTQNNYGGENYGNPWGFMGPGMMW